MVTNKIIGHLALFILVMATSEQVVIEKPLTIENGVDIVCYAPVFNENSIEQCDLKKNHRLQWFWRLIAALHECGHALSKFPCMSKQRDQSSNVNHTTEKKSANDTLISNEVVLLSYQCDRRSLK